MAETLLLRASAYLAAKLRTKGVRIDDADEVQAENLTTVTVNMVRRSMCSGDNEGLSQISQTIGSTVASVQFSNPNGSFWLSPLDKEILGLTGTGGRAGFASLAHEPWTDGE